MTADSHHADPNRYLALAFCWADLLFQIDEGRITYVAGASEPLLGMTRESLPGRRIHDIVAPEDHKALERSLAIIASAGRGEEIPLRLRGMRGQRPRVALTGHGLRKGDTDRLYLAMRMRGPSEDLSPPSPDTTRRDEHGDIASFSQAAARRLRRQENDTDRADLTLFALGDGHSSENCPTPDTQSRLAGAIGETLRKWAVDDDLVAQIAPGKFGAVMEYGTDIERLREAIRKLRDAYDPAGAGRDVEAATLRLGDRGRIDEADLARGLTYTLNRFSATTGRDLGAFADGMMNLVADTVERIEHFRSLVEQETFEVALQPIIHAKSGRVHHFEALCRFPEPDKDASPFELIHFAEETGLIHWFDLAMAKKVVARLRALPANNDRYRLAVNVSGHSICEPGYLAGLHDLLRDNPWTRGRLMFEITESSRIVDLDRANASIQKLRNLGYEVCLDDFGAGAASFQYLSVLDVDVVKIDGGAIRNALRAEKGRAFLSALTEFCRRMGVATVAEMVDTPEAFVFVRDCGCTFVQGYLFGKPSTRLNDFTTLPNAHIFTQTATG